MREKFIRYLFYLNRCYWIKKRKKNGKNETKVEIEFQTNWNFKNEISLTTVLENQITFQLYKNLMTFIFEKRLREYDKLITWVIRFRWLYVYQIFLPRDILFNDFIILSFSEAIYVERDQKIFYHFLQIQLLGN